MDKRQQQTKFHTNNSGSSIPVHGDADGTWTQQPNNNSKNHRHYKRHRYNKYFLAVISLLFAVPVNAETVGGVSATASPVANSSGSVTNQAIQVLQGPYITNTYGNGIQCQGPTRNFTPYVTGTAAASKPYEPYYWDPVYDVSDLDEDGLIDNPGDILFHKKTRTGQKDNYSLGIGFSMTWSTPTDKKLQEQCKQAAQASIELMQQQTANKRLDFEIARLKNCGDLLLKGIQFHPKSPYYKVCADVVVNNPPGHKHPHYHKIPTSSSVSETQTAMPSLQYSSDADLLGAPLQTRLEVSSPE